MQDDVLDRLNLTSAAARTRVKKFLNIKYRELQTSLGLGAVRRGLIEVSSVSGTAEYSTIDTGTASLKIIRPTVVIWNPTTVVLGARTLVQLRLMDPDLSQSGTPMYFAVVAFAATSCTIRLWPTPDETTANAIIIDGLINGTALSADSDVPAFPEDFHDYLVYAACADELDKMEKVARAGRQLQLAETRLKALRYFMATKAFLHRHQGETYWWWGPFNGSFGWRL